MKFNEFEIAREITREYPNIKSFVEFWPGNELKAMILKDPEGKFGQVSINMVRRVFKALPIAAAQLASQEVARG